MIFKGPAGGAALDVPDSIPIWKFMLSDEYGRFPMAKSRHPQVCGITGLSYSIFEVQERVEHLARAIAKDLDWHPNHGTEWDKVVGVYSANTIDSSTLSWAIHRLSGIVTPANAVHSASELAYQLKDSKAKCLFTSVLQLQTSIKAALKVGIQKHHIYLLDLPPFKHEVEEKAAIGFKTLNQLVNEGSRLEKLDHQNWSDGQSTRQTAYLCYSSGTSGIPKGVKISHRNVIANTLQLDAVERRQRRYKSKDPNYTEVVLGLLPQSHIYALIVISHAATYRGDGVITLPNYQLPLLLSCIDRFKINILFLVPPIIIDISNSPDLLAKYDLSSVTVLYTGAAPLGAETAQTILREHPSWKICQAYGTTETTGVVSSTTVDDICLGSCGSLLPTIEARLIAPTGEDIEQYDKPGELLVRSAAVALGYLNNPDATRETFDDGWMRTGDEAVIRKSPKGNEHVFIVDRIKELIKVKSFQVAPAELEAHLLTHPSIADVAVIPVSDAAAGELPKAYVVKSPSAFTENRPDDELKRDIQRHVEQHKAGYKWLKGGISFTDAIPKSPSGKILRRLLRQKDQEAKLGVSRL